MKYLFLLFFLLIGLESQAQYIQGVVYGEKDALPAASIYLRYQGKGTLSDQNGYFKLEFPKGIDSVVVQFNHIGYRVQVRNYRVPDKGNITDTIYLEPQASVLQQVEISGKKDEDVNFQRISAKSAQVIPTAFNDFNAILPTLAGVASSNEMSSSYRVRGGNFDENLIYVNDFPVYRPFFIRAAQQEGLSFVNPDMVSEVQFSAGGWEAQYGDRLSSVLKITYQTPDSLTGRAVAGFLGGSVHTGFTRDRFSMSTGVRYKNGRYLLNNIEVDGQYFPNYLDIQSLLHWDVSSKQDGSSSVEGLLTYGRNRYQVIPASRETQYGTFSSQRRLFVGFFGSEATQFDILQGGVKYRTSINPDLDFQTLVSGFFTLEEEFSDVESGYELCATSQNSDVQNECLQLLGIGTFYNYARNRLAAGVANVQADLDYRPTDDQEIKVGISYRYQSVEDDLDEFAFIDSADYIRFSEQDFARERNAIRINHFIGYGQYRYFTGDWKFRTGIRFRYGDLNQQFLVGGNASVSYQVDKTTQLNLSTGLYHQPPFYREMRDFNGNLNTGLLAQSSLHLIAGGEKDLTFWNRPFKLNLETYYKHLYNVVPYDIDNVRIRYYANNNAEAYATGMDVRLSGEFIPGAVSWFSLGLLSTREQVDGDGLGYIRRPTDQRINVSIFFQDYLPDNPTFRYSLNFQLGSGLPFGPPNSAELRNFFLSKTYRRVDLGFFKSLQSRNHFVDSYQVGLNVLNVLGFENEISYIWIREFSGVQTAVPNSLSARFVNLQLIANF